MTTTQLTPVTSTNKTMLFTIGDAASANRVFVKMKSPESGYMYYTSKNRVTTPGRLELRKYDPIVRKHVLFKETK